MATDKIDKRIQEAVAAKAAAKKLRTTSAWSDMDERAMMYYLGAQHENWKSAIDYDYVVKNVIGPSVNIMIDALVSEIVKAVGYGRYSGESQDIAQAAANILNHELSSLSPEEADRKLLLDRYCCGFCAQLITWRFSDTGTDAKLMKAEAKRGLAPGEFFVGNDNEVYHRDEMGETRIDSPTALERQIAVEEGPVLEVIPAVDVFFDPMETDLNALRRSRFIVWREYFTRDELVLDKRNDSSKIGKEGAAYLGRQEYLSAFRDSGPDAPERIEVWYYVGEDPEDNNKWVMSVRVNGGKDELRSAEWPYSYFPLIIEADIAPAGALYPISLVNDCIPHQDEINSCETDRHYHRNRAIPIILYSKSDLQQDSIDAIKRARYNKWVGIDKRSQRTWDEMVREFQVTTPSPELYAAEGGHEQSIRDILGVTEMMLGRAPDRRVTATYTMSVAQQAGIRPRALARRWRDYRKRRYQRLLLVIRDNQRMGIPRPYMFLDDAGNRAWSQYLSDQLAGDYDVSIEVVDDSFEAPQAQLMKWMQFLDIYLKVCAAGTPDPKTGRAVLANPATGGPYWNNPTGVLRRIAQAFGIDTPQELETPPAAAAQPDQQQVMQVLAQLMGGGQQMQPPAAPVTPQEGQTNG